MKRMVMKTTSEIRKTQLVQNRSNFKRHSSLHHVATGRPQTEVR